MVLVAIPDHWVEVIVPSREVVDEESGARNPLLVVIGGDQRASKEGIDVVEPFVVELAPPDDRLVAERAYDQVEGWMREMGMSEDAAHELVARAVDRIDAEDATGDPHNHLEGTAFAGALTPEIDAQLEAAQLEFEREQGMSPELAPW
jgi:hypothetical protein